MEPAFKFRLIFDIAFLIAISLLLYFTKCNDPIPQIPTEDGVTHVETKPPILDLGDQDLDVVERDKSNNLTRKRLQVPKDSTDVSDVEAVVSIVPEDSTADITHIVLEDNGPKFLPEFGLKRGGRRLSVRVLGDPTAHVYVTEQRIPLIGVAHKVSVGLERRSKTRAIVSYTPLRVWGFWLGGFTSASLGANPELDAGAVVSITPIDNLVLGVTYSATDRSVGVMAGVSVKL